MTTHTVDTLLSLVDRYRDLKVGEGTAQTRNALRAALTEALLPPYNADPSCTTVELAEMVMSDCGCSSNNTLLVSRVANRIDAHMQAAQPTAMPFVPWSKEAEMMESWTREPQLDDPFAQRVSDLVERLGGIEHLESRSSKPVQKPLTYEQIQQLYIKAYNGGNHGRDFETAFVKEIEAAHGITGSRE